MKKIKLILSFILLNTIVLPVYAVDDGDTKFIIQQDVGIKTKNPSATLHLNGTGLFEDGSVTFSNTSPVTFNSLALVNNNLQIPTGAAPGFVLVSNATGVASWADPMTVTSAGDNLGDHLATQDLDMSNNRIINADRIGIKTSTPYADLGLVSDNLNNGGILVASQLSTEYPILKGPVKGTGIPNQDSFRISYKNRYLNPMNANNDFLVIDKTDGNDSNPDGGIVFTNTGDDGISEVALSIRGSGFVGLGVINQTAKLDIGGGIRNFIDGIDDILVKDDVEVDGSVFVQDDLVLTKSAGAGKILTSDRNGKAMWTVPAMIQTNGDNMGNHTANRNLDMASKDITSVRNITATSFNGGTFNGTFRGDGSGLTNVKSSVFKILANTILNNGSLASYANNFLIGSPSMDDSGNSSHDSKLFFNKAKSAFRAGTVEGTEWNNASIGQNSMAFGKNTRASGFSSLAAGNGSVANAFSSISIGYNTTALGPYSVALGYNTLASQNFSTAFGNFSRATGAGATAFGKQTLASGIDSTAFGQEAQATRDNSVAIGKNVRASGDRAFAIGFGNSNQDMLINNINSSLAIGFATNAATLFVGPGAGASTDGKVGIGTKTPQDLLDVDGRLRTREFRMPTGASNNYVLTSDGVGTGTWKSLATIGGGGDDLGNHTATQTLNMANQDITNAKYVTAANLLVNNTVAPAIGTRIYAQVPSSAGYADFVTASRQTPASPLLTKWAVGSTGDTRDDAFGGQNTFYIFQRTNKNDAIVNGYRLAIDDTGLVGIGLHNPKAKLDVGGGVRDFIDGVNDILVKDDVEVDGTVFTSGLRMPTGAANNLVLASDASGNATWKSLGAIGGGGDDLGNHIATTHLNMSTRNITNAGTISATNFGGSGAGITNLNAANVSTGVLNIARIPDLSATKITSGVFGATVIPNLDTSKITTGTFTTARIPDLSAAKITSGVFDIARIPNIPASKIASLGIDDLTDGIASTSNVFLGQRAGQNGVLATARWNTALGHQAGSSITTGTTNVAIGGNSMSGNYLGARGSRNTAIGTSSLVGAGLAEDNTALGYMAGHSIVDGDKNIAIGVQSLQYADGPNANENIAIGYQTGRNMNEGRSNILIGNRTDVQSTYSNFSGGSNIFIGNSIVGTGGTFNNQLNIGNLIRGNMTGAKSVNIDGSLEADNIKLTTGAGANKVLTSDASGNATWQTAPSGADNLGNHSATRDLNMADNDILNAGNIGSKDINAKRISATGMSIKTDIPGAYGTRVYAEIPVADGYADFVTTTRGPGGVLAEKWAVGSLGDTRPDGNGGPNAFYIFQHKNKNNTAVNKYRYHVTDTGFTGIDTQGAAKATLDVGGGVPNFINGQGDLLVKDDAEIDGNIFAGEVNTGCIVLGDGTRICSKQDIIDIISEAGSSNNTGCSADGYYHIPHTSVSNAGTNDPYGSGPSTVDFTQCDKAYYRDTGHSLTRTWSFVSPPRSGPVVFRAYRDRTGQSIGSGTWYWFNNANITITNATQAIHDGRRNGLKEFRCNYDKPTNRYTCTYHAL